jgi:hypothetical protein
VLASNRVQKARSTRHLHRGSGFQIHSPRRTGKYDAEVFLAQNYFGLRLRHEQLPDCRQAGQRSGVSFRTLPVEIILSDHQAATWSIGHMWRLVCVDSQRGAFRLPRAQRSTSQVLSASRSLLWACCGVSRFRTTV